VCAGSNILKFKILKLFEWTQMKKLPKLKLKISMRWIIFLKKIVPISDFSDVPIISLFLENTNIFKITFKTSQGTKLSGFNSWRTMHVWF
jgi:hypothetical protein